MARSEIKMRSKRDPTHSNGVFLQIMSHNGSFYHSFFLCHTFPIFSIFYRCHSYPICSTQPKMRSSAQFIRPNLKTLRSLIRIRWTRINMRPQSCQSAFTNSFGDSIPFTHLTTWFNPRGRRVSVICNSLTCPQDLWSTSFGEPPSDASQDYNLIAASESDGSTVVEFSRDAVTGDDAKDVQFMVRLF